MPGSEPQVLPAAQHRAPQPLREAGVRVSAAPRQGSRAAGRGPVPAARTQATWRLSDRRWTGPACSPRPHCCASSCSVCGNAFSDSPACPRGFRASTTHTGLSRGRLTRGPAPWTRLLGAAGPKAPTSPAAETHSPRGRLRGGWPPQSSQGTCPARAPALHMPGTSCHLPRTTAAGTSPAVHQGARFRGAPPRRDPRGPHRWHSPVPSALGPDQNAGSWGKEVREPLSATDAP